MPVLRSSVAVFAAGMFVFVAGCGGGGGGGSSQTPDPPSSSPPGSTQPPPDTTQPPPGSTQPDPTTDPPPATVSGTVTYQSTDLTFSTALHNSTAAEQTIPFTITGAPAGAPKALVLSNGRSLLVSANVVFNGDGTGSVRFRPDTAARLNLGTNTGSLTITICLDDEFCRSKVIGQPQTFNVTYNVTTTVQGTTVTPRVAAANQTGTVILRGKGFANVTAVRFGTTAASNVTVVSDTEIRAAYPALALGRYDLSIDGAAAAFAGSLTTVATPTYTATLVPFGSTPYIVSSALYDAEREALLVVAQAQDQNNQLVKFAYNGTTWNLESTTTIPGLHDITFTPDGSALIAATSSQLIELNPVTLAAGASYTPPETAPIQSVALANDGYLIVTTNDRLKLSSPIYLYSTQDHTFARPDVQAPFTIAGSSPSGSFVGLVLATSPTANIGLPQYDASTQLFSGLSSPPRNEDSSEVGFLRPVRPALDFLGTTLILSTVRFGSGFNLESSTVAFRTNTLQRFGQTLPSFVHGVSVTSDASRAYTLNSQFGLTSNPLELRTYDLAQFTQIGASVPLGVNAGDASIQTATTPDGRTLFIVGDFGLKVQPLP